MLDKTNIKNYIKRRFSIPIQNMVYEGIYRRLDSIYNLIRIENEKNRTLERYFHLPDKVLDFFFRGQEFKFYLPDADIDGIQAQILRTKTFYEIECLEKLYTFIQGNKRQVIDIGANIGNHTLFFSKICNFSECYAFEPNPAVNHILRKNIKLNNLNAKVKIFNSGIGSEKSIMYLGSSPQENLGATKLQKQGIASGQLDIVALDDMNLNNVDLIKIDVEGMAMEVLKGAQKTIVRNKPILFVELFDDEIDEGKKILESLGYVLECSLAYDNYIFRAQS